MVLHYSMSQQGTWNSSQFYMRANEKRVQACKCFEMIYTMYNLEMSCEQFPHCLFFGVLC